MALPPFASDKYISPKSHYRVRNFTTARSREIRRCKCLRWCIRHEKHIVILFVPFLCQNIVRMNIQRSLLDSSTLVQRVIYSDELYRANLNESILESDKTR